MILVFFARFGCEKLILVGDPKQLDPTIQSGDVTHDCGLEQTLFDRLVKMVVVVVVNGSQVSFLMLSSCFGAFRDTSQLYCALSTDATRPSARFPTNSFTTATSLMESLRQIDHL